MDDTKRHKFIEKIVASHIAIKNGMAVQYFGSLLGWGNKYFECENCKMILKNYANFSDQYITCEEYIIKSIIE